MSKMSEAKIQTLYADFARHLQKHGADEQAYTLYRTQLRAALHELPAQDALTRIVRLEMMLPPRESALCAAMRLDEGIFDMRAGHLPHALNALKDSCSMSASCRDHDGMVEGALALAQCFHQMRDDASAKRSAELAQRSIQTHFGGNHPKAKQAKAFASGDFSNSIAPEHEPETPKVVPQDLPPSFISPEELAKIDPSLQAPSFTAVDDFVMPALDEIEEETVEEVAEEPAAEQPQDNTDALFEQEDTFEEIKSEPAVQEEYTQEAPVAEPAVEYAEAPQTVQEAVAAEPAEEPQTIEAPVEKTEQAKPAHVLQLAPMDGSIYLQNPEFVVGFSKKNERIVGSSQRRRDVLTAILVGAQNGLLPEDPSLDAAVQQQIAHWDQLGKYDEALAFLGALQEALPENSAYQTQVCVWTAQMLAACGDVEHAIGLYSRLAEQMLQNGTATEPLGMETVQQLCELYHQAEQFPRELALRKLMFRLLNQKNADAEAILSAGEEYMQALLDHPDAAELTAMLRWCAKQKGDHQLYADCVDVLLPLLDEAQDDAAVCELCAMAQEHTTANEWIMQDNWITAWLLATLNLGDAEKFGKLAMHLDRELCTDAQQDVCAAVLQCAKNYAEDGDYDAAVDYYTICLNVHASRGDEEAEKDTALQLADTLKDAGRTMEAADIRAMYISPVVEEEVVEEVVEEPAEVVVEEAEIVEEPVVEAAEETVEAPEAMEDDADDFAEEPAEPVTAESLRAEAEAAQAAGDLQRACALRGEIYQMRKAALGAEHPDTLAAQNNFAKALSAVGELKAAVLHQLEAVQGYANTMGQNHAYTLTAMHNLASNMERAGQFTEALAVRETVYRLYSETYPADHVEVQRARKRMLRARKLTTKI